MPRAYNDHSNHDRRDARKLGPLRPQTPAEIAADEARYAELEAEGLTRSDAQAVVEAEQMR